MSCLAAPDKAQVYNKQDYDLMVFPESDTQRAVDIDVEKLTQAELEKLLLDDSFESRKTPILPVTPVLNPSLSTQLYLRPAIPRRDSGHLDYLDLPVTLYLLFISQLTVLNRLHSKMASTQECLLLHPQNLYI